MSPTQLIYAAWKNTPRPIIYNTSDGKGNAIKAECNFIDPAENPDYETAWQGNCTICGASTVGGIANKKMFSGHYCDWGIHKAQQSDHVCAGCAFTMLLNMQSHRCGLLRYSFLASDTLKICNRAQVRDYIINPPTPPFVMVVAVSQKKHLAIKSRMSYDRENYFCMLEEECIQVNRQQAEDTIKVCEALRGIGMTKDEICKGIIRFDKIKDFKLDAFDKINHALRPCMGSRLFDLCLFVAQKMTEEEAICYLDLIPKMKESQQVHSASMQSINREMSNEVHQDMKCGSKLKDLSGEPQCEQMTWGDF